MSEPGPSRFGVAINHFAKEGRGEVQEQSTRLCVTLVRRCPEVGSIVVADGSPEPSRSLRDHCHELRAGYLHEPGGMPFARTFNRAATPLPEPWVALLCSDVYVRPDTFARFERFIDRRPELPIGCLVPYLNRADVPVQEGLGPGVSRHSARASLMTINLNAFPRQVFDAVGGVPEELGGCFNDVELCIRLARAGLGVYLVGGARAVHYGALTRDQGTDVRYRADYRTFHALHPELRASGGLWDVRLDGLLDNRLLRTGYRLGIARNRIRRLRGLPPHREQFRTLLRLVPRLQRL